MLRTTALVRHMRSSHALITCFIRSYHLSASEEADVRKLFTPSGSDDTGSVDLVLDNDTRVANIVLNNPIKRNALSGNMMIDLLDIVSELENWTHGNAVLLSGAAGNFCSGAELGLVNRTIEAKSTGKFCSLMQSILTRFQYLPLVTLALIEGNALGGGAELTTVTDFRVMTQGARVGFLHSKLNAVTGFGGSCRLVDIVGRTKALELLTSGRIVTAHEAQDINFVSTVLPEGCDAHKSAMDWLLTHSQGTAKYFKLLVNGEDRKTRLESLRIEHEIFTKLFGSEDHIKALNAGKKHR